MILLIHSLDASIQRILRQGLHERLPKRTVNVNICQSKDMIQLSRGPIAFAGFSHNVNKAEHIKKLRKRAYHF